MKNKKSSHISVWLMIALIAVISYIAFTGALKDGVTLNNDNRNGVNNIESIEELQDKVYFTLDIPSFVTETDEELNIKVIAGQVVSINTTTFVLKASSFVDVEADILGLYEESKIDKTYNVNDSNIIYFEYRQGYKDYPNCTIINWCTNETSYGLMIEDDISLDRALEIIGIDSNNISVYNETNAENENTVSYNTDDFIEYIIDNQLIIKLPQFKGNVTHVDTAGVSAFFSGDTLLFLVVYNEKDIQEGTYSEQSVIDVSDNIKIYYSDNNTYDKGSDAYSDYELMLLTIDDIGKTIVYK